MEVNNFKSLGVDVAVSSETMIVLVLFLAGVLALVLILPRKYKHRPPDSH